MGMGMFYVYIIRSVGWPGHRYIGYTTDIKKRLGEHNSGKCSFTRKLRPWKVIYYERFENETLALKRERQIKSWAAAKKTALICGDLCELKRLSKRRV